MNDAIIRPEVATLPIIDTDPVVLHDILSKLPYGEENSVILESVTEETTMQLPCWTSQLRLCLRAPRLASLVLPHVWNKVQQQLLLGDDDDDGHVDDLIEATLPQSIWKNDYMIQHWHLTRFHIVRESSEQLGTTSILLLRQIMNHIDEYAIRHRLPSSSQIRKTSFPSFSDLGYNSNGRKSPQSVLEDYYQDKNNLEKEAALAELKKSSSVTISPTFVRWVAAQVHLKQGNDKRTLESAVRKLCRRVGKDRQRLRKVQAEVENLPLQGMADALVQLKNFQINRNGLQLKQGRALLAGLLKAQKVDIVLEPLPEELLLWKDEETDYDLVHIMIDNYLSSSALPNVNSLVVFLWSHRISRSSDGYHVKSISPWVSWLPVEPIVPLLRQCLQAVGLQQHNNNHNDAPRLEEARSAIAFFMQLEYDQQHAQDAFECLLASVPTNETALKRACAEKFRLVEATSSQSSTTTARRPIASGHGSVIQQMWGTTGDIAMKEPHAFALDTMDVNDDDNNDDDKEHYDYVDETDDRILLL